MNIAVSMDRRKLVLALAGAFSPRPLLAQPRVPVIGYLHSGALEQNVARVAAFRKGLQEAGFVEGRNVVIDFRWADGRQERLSGDAADLVRRQVAVIVSPASAAATFAAKAATATIPVVFATGADPVALGLVASLNRPGGNVTGINTLNVDLGAKRLGLLRELVPQATRYLLLVNSTSYLTKPFLAELQPVIAGLGLQSVILRAGTEQEIDAVFANLPRQAGTVLVVNSDAFFYIRRDQIIALAARHGLPAIFDNRDYIEAGGLISYGADWLDMMQLAGSYAARILKGEAPADLPVVQSTRLELVINLKTAKTLGISVPATLLATADGVVE
jgi:putative ABC transport system substrate-binding protein